MEVANASLLDEGTAAAEALGLAHRYNKRKKLFISDKVHPQTISVIATRAASLGLTLQIGNVFQVDPSGKDIAGILVQYPDTTGSINDFSSVIERAHEYGVSSLNSICNNKRNKSIFIDTLLSFLDLGVCCF